MKYLLAITLLGLSVSTLCAAKTVIGISEIPGSIPLNKTTFYEKVLSKKAKSANLIKKNYKEISTLFYDKKINCIYPISKKTHKIAYPGEYTPIFSKPILVINVRLYTLKGQPKIKRLSDITSKKIVTSKYLKTLFPTAKYTVTVDHTPQRIKMLEDGEVDIIAELNADFLTFATDRTRFESNKHLKIKKYSQIIMCHDTPENRLFLKSL